MTATGPSREAKRLAQRSLPVTVGAEDYKVVLWRVQQLEAAGMEPVHAVAIAVTADADWRLAERMSRRGAKSSVVAEVVL